MCERSNATGKLGKPKGYGFLQFAEQRHALKALRKLNNCPTTFTPQKRPIVEFSIESLVALNKQKFRQLKAIRTQQASGNVNVRKRTEVEDDEEDLPFTGVKSKPTREDQPVQVPKMNRKIFNQKKELRARGKKQKAEKKALVLQKAKEAKQKQREFRKPEMKFQKDAHRKKRAAREAKEVEKFDALANKHLGKRRNAFRNERNYISATKSTKTVTKKQKWYENDT